MVRSEAIRLKCLDCAGMSRKEVTLCMIFDCPLWPYRMGSCATATSYVERMAKAEKNYPVESREFRKALTDCLENECFSSLSGPQGAILEKNRYALEVTLHRGDIFSISAHTRN